ncbi:MAG: hypothetical protein HY704_11585 [Gemmatimonadetes bacterium]|nr:hypothetical protein [Gemmatimonadota bacterium]
MQHLDLEILARLVDGTLMPEEEAHLAACVRCRDELEALRQQTERLRALPDLLPPGGDWDTLERRLAHEGLIRTATRRPPWARTDIWLRAAAAAVLFIGGAAFGRALEGGLFRSGTVADADDVASLQNVATVEDAANAVRLAQGQYFDALLRYRELAGADGPEAVQVGDPAGRFAALEALVAASQAAVRHAPADPFLNGVLVSAVAEREHVLRQIATVQRDNWF